MRTAHTARLTSLERGWLRMLDLDLELAQRMLRLPRAARPVPPVAVAAVLVEDWDGTRVVLAEAIPAPPADEPVEAAPPSVQLRGAYARRAARG